MTGRGRAIRATLGALAALLAGKGMSAQTVALRQIWLHPAREIAPADPRLWGTNLLFWIDDDRALAQGVPQMLRQVSVGLLRFPGGGVAQNYDWRTNRLMNPARWPHGPDGGPTTNTDEFIALCRQVGAEPAIVVNTEGWILRGDLARGAREAAAWVRYCNIERKYGVKIWEIGNENYFHVTQNAREYAACVRMYSRAMKAVDPSIQVAVNGPWSTAMYGEGDLVPPALRTVMLDYERRITTAAQTRIYDAARAALKAPSKNGAPPGADSPAVATILADYEAQGATPERRARLAAARATLQRDATAGITWAQPWWETVVPLCGAEVDIVTLHVYYPRRRIPEIGTEFLRVQALFAHAHPQHKYRWFYSEFNSIDPSLGEAERALDNMELWLRLAGEGMDLACVWPFRWGGDYAALFDRTSGRIRPLGRLMAAVAPRWRGRLIAAECNAADVPVFCARAADGRATVAVFGQHRGEVTEVTLHSDPGLGTAMRATAWVVTSDGRDLLERPVAVAPRADGTGFSLPPASLVLIQFSPSP